MLTPTDLQNLLALVRTSTPRDFEDGKQLVVLEAKIGAALEHYQKQQIDTQVAEQVAAKLKRDKPKKHGVKDKD